MANLVSKVFEDEINEALKNYVPTIGDIQIDPDGSEWVIVGITHSGFSRLRRNSLSHRIHAQRSEAIAKALT